MNIEALKKKLRPWLLQETWHSSHPSDTKRFNRAVLSAIEELGTAIDFTSAKKAIIETVQETYPNWDKEMLGKYADKFAANIEIIVTFHADVKN